jgi:hypothetical protein
MISSHDCPKCQKRMDPGHIPDVAHGSVDPAGWTLGLPVPRRFLAGIKYNKKAQVPLIAYRCPKCGYVELYAGP